MLIRFFVYFLLKINKISLNMEEKNESVKLFCTVKFLLTIMKVLQYNKTSVIYNV